MELPPHKTHFGTHVEKAYKDRQSIYYHRLATAQLLCQWLIDNQSACHWLANGQLLCDWLVGKTV